MIPISAFDKVVGEIDQRELVERVTAAVLAALRSDEAGKGIPVGVSVRHLHISQEDLEVLYGPGARLTKARDLRQQGEFAANETVTLIGPRLRALEGVRILGPVRKQTQVEISRTDAILLGLDPPVRRSGDIAGTPGITVAGPKGVLHLREGVIRANRHIHMSAEEAAGYGVKDNDEVEVEFDGPKGLVFRHVQIRVGQFRLEMHLDTDDANAAGVGCGARARIIRR